MIGVIFELLILAGLVLALRIALRGAPYLPSKHDAITEMVAFAKAAPGRRIAELGSGDGRVAIALAEAGATVDGYELSRLLARQSRRKVAAAGLTDRVTIHRQDLWKADLSGSDAVVVFGMSHIMKRLAAKFRKELKPGSLIVSNAFALPGFEAVQTGRHATVYRVE